MVIYLSPGIFAQDCLSLRKLLLHFSVMHVPREKCVQARAYIHKQSVGLEKNISQRDLLLVVMTVWWLFMSQLASAFFSLYYFFSVIAKPSLCPYITYPKVQSEHSHLPACITFPGDFSRLV